MALIFSVWAIFLNTTAVQCKSVFLQRETPFRGNGFLQALDLVIDEFFDAATVQAH